MPNVQDLTNKELAFMLLLKLWGWLDVGGVSGRRQDALVIEILIRQHLLSGPRDLDEWKQLDEEVFTEEARKRKPDTWLTADVSFSKPLSRFRNREYVAVLLRWLKDWYDREMERGEEHDPYLHRKFFMSLFHLLPVPVETPVLQYGELNWERSRRAHKRNNRLRF